MRCRIKGRFPHIVASAYDFILPYYNSAYGYFIDGFCLVGGKDGLFHP
jgi:hypothetical protein